MSATETPMHPGPYRSTVLLGTTAALFAAGLIVNWFGVANFPSNAPVEQIYGLGISLDLLAGFVAALAGAILSTRHRYPLKRRSVVTIIGLAFVGVAFAAFVGLSGIGMLERIATLGRGRYMYDVAGVFYAGAFWVVGTLFCAFGYRRGGTRGNAVRALVGTIVGLLLLAATVTSAVLYGLALTD